MGYSSGLGGCGPGYGFAGFPLGYGGYFYPTVDWQYWFDYYRIPYFAKHPPVYYSYPVPRTYGYSPYAYPPGTRTPEVVKPEPLTIQNKYVPRKATAEPAENQVTSAPLRIRNPYVAQPEAELEASQAVALANPHMP
jgi:hypothetical protein